MNTQDWEDVDRYFTESFVSDDAALAHALAASAAADLPAINVTPTQGKFLHLLARAIGARHILEVGTLGGYSTIWLAQALPGEGRIVTLEVDPHCAAVARSNFQHANLSARIDLREGPALDTLAQLATEDRPFFDLVFLDADKEHHPDYFTRALGLTRPGALIIADNMVRDGAVLDADTSDPNIQGIRRLVDLMAGEPRVEVSALQTVGSKGYDGFAIALVTA